MAFRFASWFQDELPVNLIPPGSPEPFIPLHILDLVRLLYPKVEQRGQDAEQFRLFCRLVLSLLHQQYRKRHQHLTHLYSTLDPDLDFADDPHGATDKKTDLNVSVESSSEFRPQYDRNADRSTSILFDEIGDILERANYRRLSPRQIQLAVGSSSRWGVKLRV